MPQSSVGGRKAPAGAVPFRDRQQETPRFFCAQCGQEQYTYDPPAVAGLCPQCRRRNRQREENAMTLQEMSVEYRAQAQVLQGRIEALKQTQDTLDRVRLGDLDPRFLRHSSAKALTGFAERLFRRYPEEGSEGRPRGTKGQKI